MRIEKSELKKIIIAGETSYKPESTDNRFMEVILYFLYPKLKDIQKPLLIVIGYLTGIFLLNGVFTVQLFVDNLYSLLICLLVFDFLAYQARYQYNDICGISEDLAVGAEGRLPVKILGAKRAIITSFIIIIFKIIIAFFIAFKFGGEIGNELIKGIGILFFITFIYECFRRKKANSGIFFAVSLGYPLRIIVGLLASWPGVFEKNIVDTGMLICSDKLVVLGILLLAYCFFGEFSATLPWAHEAIKQNKETHSLRKEHYKFILEKLANRTSKPTPLREKGSLTDIWNLSFVLSISLLSFMACIFYPLDMKVYIFEILTIGLSIAVCKLSHKHILTSSFFLIVLSVVKFVILLKYSYFNIYILIYLNQIFFTSVYLFIRYNFESKFSFTILIKFILTVLIGKETLEYIESEK